MSDVRWLMCEASLARCEALGLPGMDDAARDLGFEVAVGGVPASWKGGSAPVVGWGHRKFLTRTVRACLEGIRLIPWHDPAPLGYRNLGERYRAHLLHDDFRIVPLSEVPRFDRGRDLFLRAEAGGRAYPGVVVGGGSLALGIAAHPKLGLIPPDTPCAVATARDVEDEHRFVIVDGRVVSGTRHRQGRYHRVCADVPRAARDAAEAVAAEPWQPVEAYACDVGTSVDGRAAVIGFGPFSTAQLNATDPVAVVRAASEAARRHVAGRLAA